MGCFFVCGKSGVQKNSPDGRMKRTCPAVSRADQCRQLRSPKRGYAPDGPLLEVGACGMIE